MDPPPAYPGAVGVVQPLYATPAAAQVVHTTTTATDHSQTRTRRTANTFNVILVLMFVCLAFGMTMMIANAYSAGKGVKTYDNYKYDPYSWTERKARRDWYQGVWSGVLHIVLALFFFGLYVQAKKLNFNLDTGSLRGVGYFFCVCASIMCVVAFVAMVMSGITAAFLSDKDNHNGYSSSNDCRTGYNLDGPYCWCGDKNDYIAKATCSDAGGVYHGLFTTIAVLNAVSVIVFIVAAILACLGSSATCCGGYYYNYSSPGVVVTTGPQVVQTVPQVAIAYPVQGQMVTTY